MYDFSADVLKGGSLPQTTDVQTNGHGESQKAS